MGKLCYLAVWKALFGVGGFDTLSSLVYEICPVFIKQYRDRKLLSDLLVSMLLQYGRTIMVLYLLQRFFELMGCFDDILF